jgi:hypothetical protein
MFGSIRLLRTDFGEAPAKSRTAAWKGRPHDDSMTGTVVAATSWDHQLGPPVGTNGDSGGSHQLGPVGTQLEPVVAATSWDPSWDHQLGPTGTVVAATSWETPVGKPVGKSRV